MTSPPPCAPCAPSGIDLYYDNVGGEILDICLAQLAMRGRIVLCGAISVYNEKSRPGAAQHLQSHHQAGTDGGFLVLDYLDRFLEAQIDMVGWLAQERSNTPSILSTASSMRPRP